MNRIKRANKLLAMLIMGMSLQSCAIFVTESDGLESKPATSTVQSVSAVDSKRQAALAHSKQISCAIEAQSDSVKASSKTLEDILASAHNNLEQYPKSVALPIEMMFSLYHGLMVPGHSREVGKEFSLIFKADSVSVSPTLNTSIDYQVFSHSSLNNGNRCFVPSQNLALYRVMVYAKQMDKAQWQLLRQHQAVLYSELLHLAFLLNTK